MSPYSKQGNDGACGVSVDESVDNYEKKKGAESATRESVTTKTVEKVGVAVYSLLNYNYSNTWKFRDQENTDKKKRLNCQ